MKRERGNGRERDAFLSYVQQAAEYSLRKTLRHRDLVLHKSVESTVA